MIISSFSNMDEKARAYNRQAIMAHRSRQKQELARLRTNVNRYRVWFDMPLLEDSIAKRKHQFIDKKTVPTLPPKDKLVNDMNKEEITAWKINERFKRRSAMQVHAKLERKVEKASLENELNALHTRFLTENQGVDDIEELLERSTI